MDMVQPNWSDELSASMGCGSEDDPNRLYVSLKDGHLEEGVSIPGRHPIAFLGMPDFVADFATKHPKPDTLVLFSIHVPEEQRRHGCSKEVLDLLEKRVDAEERHLFVGPFVTEEADWLAHECRKRGYKPQMPFGMIRQAKLAK